MYDVDKEKSNWLKPILILLGLVLVIFIILFLVKSCGTKEKTNTDLESILLNAGKEDFTANGLPEAVGECKTVTLGSLIENDYIEDVTTFATCDNELSYVQVCKLESGVYQYTPVLSCTDNATSFTDWVVGTEDDLIANKSDVRFTYLVERKEMVADESKTTSTSNTKYYYPSNYTSASKVKQYYISKPADGYAYKDSATSQAAKWYTESSTGGELWNNGAYSSVEPSGYSIKLNEKVTNTGITKDKPAEAANRTITPTTVYQYSLANGTAAPYRYKCWSEAHMGYLYSFTRCDQLNSEYNLIQDFYYSCVGKGSMTDPILTTNDVAAGTSCGYTTTACGDSSYCKTYNGYTYTDKEWQWKSESTTVKSYYPSGKATAAEENTYYIEAPVTGAIKDTTTVTTAFKYYKMVSSTNQVITGTEKEEWIKVNEDYEDEATIIQKLKNLNFEVNSLKEIEDNENLRYTVKMEYRNRIDK